MSAPAKFWLLTVCTVLLVHSGKTHANQGKHLLVFGDSLSAAYGIDFEQGWAQLIGAHWAARQLPHKVTNASISGETTKGGLDRLPITLEEFKPDVVMLELGANDGLRGYPVARMQQNLEQMVEIAQGSGAIVLLVGIAPPPSMGPRYIDQFRQVFRDIARQQDLPFIDFYREEYFSKPGYIQADGLHPTELPQAEIRDAVLSFFAEHDLFN